jgi:hypothetical protein
MPGVNIFCRTVFCVLCKKHTEKKPEVKNLVSDTL